MSGTADASSPLDNTDPTPTVVPPSVSVFASLGRLFNSGRTALTGIAREMVNDHNHPPNNNPQMMILQQPQADFNNETNLLNYWMRQIAPQLPVETPEELELRKNRKALVIQRFMRCVRWKGRALRSQRRKCMVETEANCFPFASHLIEQYLPIWQHAPHDQSPQSPQASGVVAKLLHLLRD